MSSKANFRAIQGLARRVIAVRYVVDVPSLPLFLTRATEARGTPREKRQSSSFFAFESVKIAGSEKGDTNTTPCSNRVKVFGTTSRKLTGAPS